MAHFGLASIAGLISIQQANCPVSGELTREADLSTQQTGAQAPSRLPRPPGHHRRQEGTSRAPRPRPQAPERLNLTATALGRFCRRSLMERLRQRADFLAVADAGARVSAAAFVLQCRRR